MKKLLLLLGVIASVNAFATGEPGNTTPSCKILNNPSDYNVFWDAGKLDMKPGDCYQVTVWSPGADGIGKYEFKHIATLIFQLDGNVALYSYDSYYQNTAVQGLGMENKNGINFVYQEDNNLVLYAQDKVLWAADSDHKKYSHASLGFNSDNYASAVFYLSGEAGGEADKMILHATPSWK